MELPGAAAFRHTGLRDGFEVVFLRGRDDGLALCGSAAAVEDGRPWTVAYEIVVDRRWSTRSATVITSTEVRTHTCELRTDGHGAWTVDGVDRADLAGCLDVDLEASACTNTLPVHRHSDTREAFDAPAAYVRVDGTVSRLEQRYRPIPGSAAAPEFDYVAPAFDFTCRMVFDSSLLVIDYPGIAVRCPASSSPPTP